MPWLQDYRLVASSRHLIVLSHMTGYLLSNPATEELLHLPPASWYKARHPYRHCTGFGFVPSLGKYKLLSITFGPQDTQICEVFTVGVDDSWRRGKSPPFRVTKTKYHSSMPCLNGNLHMLSLGSIDFAGSMDENWRVLLFDLDEETWSAKALPVVEKIGGTTLELREMRGFLCFVCCIPGRTIDVWMMRDYASSVWSKDFVIDGTHLEIRKGLCGFPLEVMSDGRIFIETTGGGWLYYDPKDGSFQLSGHQGFPNVVYAENLVPILGF
ncbi:unnamed protein product [Urochloa humidicola]